MQEKPPEIGDRFSHSEIRNSLVTPRIIRLVADDGVIDRREVNAYLVGSAGFYLDVEEREFVIAFLDLPRRESCAAVSGDTHSRAIVFVAR